MSGEPPMTVPRRISEAIKHNPIGALILTTATISAVFYSTLSLAWNNLNSAAARIDRISQDIGHMKASFARLEKMENALVSIQSSNITIQKKLDDYRPYEARLAESFGIKVSQNIPVVLYRGQTFAIPQTTTAETAIRNAGFRHSTAQFVVGSITANGWLLPEAETLAFVPTGSATAKKAQPK